MLNRREWICTSIAGAATLIVSRDANASELPPSVVTVYKDSGCECCAKWAKHLSANGFVVSVRDVSNMDEIKKTMHVPAAMRSCHTAVVDRYVIEGHVPADVIKKFLASKPTSLGLAAPGMPNGSPGMEGGRVDHYDIIAFERDGTSRIYAKR